MATISEEGLPKKPSPPKPKHGVGKGLMMMSSLVTQDPDCCLLTYKDYAVEMIGSIIKDKDVDPCAEEGTEELGLSGLFDFARVHPFLFFSLFIRFYSLIADGSPVL